MARQQSKIKVPLNALRVDTDVFMYTWASIHPTFEDGEWRVGSTTMAAITFRSPSSSNRCISNGQVSVIARAVMEQLQEERKDEIAALRADIYSDVKVRRSLCVASPI